MVPMIRRKEADGYWVTMGHHAQEPSERPSETGYGLRNVWSPFAPVLAHGAPRNFVPETVCLQAIGLTPRCRFVCGPGLCYGRCSTWLALPEAL